jgi:hypothetical protein
MAATFTVTGRSPNVLRYFVNEAGAGGVASLTATQMLTDLAGINGGALHALLTAVYADNAAAARALAGGEYTTTPTAVVTDTSPHATLRFARTNGGVLGTSDLGISVSQVAGVAQIDAATTAVAASWVLEIRADNTLVE